MKTIKLNFLLVIMALGVFTFTSCEDEFTEEDFLDKQAQLAATQHGYDLEKLILEYNLSRENDSLMRVFQTQLTNAINDENTEALRQAGLLTSYTVTIENQGGVPIEGATVSLAGSNSGARVDVVTDATGQAILNDVVIGDNPVQVSAAGFVGVSYILELGTINNGTDYITINNKVYPLGRSETSRISLVSSDGASGTFGTVKGTATIETNVTNLTSEIPQDVTIVAYINGTNFSGGGVAGMFNTTVTMSDFRFMGEGIGSAVVDNTTGAWSMLLPASESGIQYTFQIPTITADQTIAIDERDEVAIAPEYATVPTMFGPAAGAYSTVNSVPGARAVFTAAPAQGTGFGLTYTQVARALDAGANTGTGANNTFINNTDVSVGADVYRMTSRGSALSTSPTATAVGGNGTGTAATFTTAIAGRITALAIGTAGTNYAANETLTIRVTPQNATPANTATDIENDGIFSGNNSFIDFTVTITTVGGGGAITGISLPTTGVGFASDAYFGTGVTQYTVVVDPTATYAGAGTGAVLSVAGVSASVSSFTVATGGTLYTGAPTSITFAGGGGVGGTPVLPSLSLVGMSFDYTIAPSGGTGYAVLPSMSSTIKTSFTGALSTTANAIPVDGTVVGTATSLVGEFTLVGGVPTLKNTRLVYRTGRSFTAPVAVITADPSTTAVATVGIDGTTGSATYGQVLNIISSGTGGSVGSGYAAPFTVTIEPSIATAPGSGAVVSLSGFTFNATTGEYTWGGSAFTGNNHTVTQAGSGYLPNLNQGGGAVGYSGAPGAVTVISGSVQNFDIKYGTGRRTQNVD